MAAAKSAVLRFKVTQANQKKIALALTRAVASFKVTHAESKNYLKSFKPAREFLAKQKITIVDCILSIKKLLSEFVVLKRTDLLCCECNGDAAGA